MTFQKNKLRADNGEALLETERLTKRFNGVIAVDHVDVIIRKGELMSLIGPNGSGKTTFFNCVTGFLRPEEGRICFKGEDITNKRPDKIVLQGIGRTFQNVRIFPGLTVLENMLLSLQEYQERNLIMRTLQTRKIKQLEACSVERAERLLEEVGMINLRDEVGNSLVYGQRKMLEFVCALMPDPDLVMLDEPTAGVSKDLIDQMKEFIVELNGRGKTFLVVEHNMGVVMDISQRIVVLDYGKKIAEGAPKEIQENKKVQEAYFGV